MLTRTGPMPWVTDEYWLSPDGGRVKPPNWAEAGVARIAASARGARNRERFRFMGLLHGREQGGFSPCSCTQGSPQGFAGGSHLQKIFKRGSLSTLYVRGQQRLPAPGHAIVLGRTPLSAVGREGLVVHEILVAVGILAVDPAEDVVEALLVERVLVPEGAEGASAPACSGFSS